MNLSLRDMKGEEWIDIPQFDGYYAVSNYGRIWALPRPVHTITNQHYYTKERIRKQTLVRYYNSYAKDYTDQLTVHLRYGPVNYSFQVSRLVYELFVGPLDSNQPNLRVIHRDGDNCNNRYDNLVLMNGTQIYRHGLKLNKRPRTSHATKKRKQLIWSDKNSPRSIVKYTLSGKKLDEYESLEQAAKANGVYRSSIRQAAKKEMKQLNGYVYRYKGDRYKGEYANFSWEKSVTQHSVEGKKIAEYPSVKQASAQTGIDANTISRCALQKARFGGGYVWRYQGDVYRGEYAGTVRNKAKAIIQYSLAGETIANFPSVNQAAMQTGFTSSTILDCAHKRTRVSHGFVWRFEGDSYDGEFKNYRTGKPVTQYTRDGKKLSTFASIEAAANATGLTTSNIQKNVAGANKTAGGFIWRLATDKEIEKLPTFEAPAYDKRNVVGKEVVQYSLDGKRIAGYACIADAARACHAIPNNISDALDKQRICAGFVWRSKGNRYYGELAKSPARNKARVVTQYSLEGKKVSVFKSTKEAEAQTNVTSSTISAVANGKLKTTGGFIWLYGDGPENIDVEAHFASSREMIRKISKPVAKYSLEGEFLSEYPSIAAAARAEGVSVNRISSAINGLTKSALGFYWRLQDK